MCLICALAVSAKDFIVVVDAGHGGRDTGAIGKSATEKSINLAVAKALGKKLLELGDDVKVVYTREKDVFIPLNERANIANKAKGDLFISIHVNSIDPKSKNARTIKGAQVYTLGLHKSESNLAVAQRENSVMMLEADYSETYKGFDPNSAESYIAFELNQSRHLDRSISFAALAQNQLTTTAGRADKGVRQAGFWVLHATSMPAVLVELDFICNPTSERFLASKDGQDKLAEALANAVESYRGMVCGTEVTHTRNQSSATEQPHRQDDTAASTAQTTKKKKEKRKSAKETRQPDEAAPQQASAIAPGQPEYRVQIYLSTKLLKPDDKVFKGLKGVSHYSDGGYYKYTVGSFASREDAVKLMKSLSSDFNGAFVLKFIDGKRVK